MKFPDTPLRRGLCDCQICSELLAWWWQAMWLTLTTIAMHVEMKELEDRLDRAWENYGP